MLSSLLGRDAEIETIEEVLESGRLGPSLLIIEGDPGIGKTTLWREGIARAHGFQVLSCRAAQAEARLSFAALTDLLDPVGTEVLAGLPPPQRAALEAALLRADAPDRGPDPRAIGAGLVSLVNALAEERPLLIAVDDVQWLDTPSARALAFLTRRLGASPVAVLATRRAGTGAPDGLLGAATEGVRRCAPGPLRLAALYQLAAPVLGDDLTRPLLTRIARASGGNPYWALEIARAIARDGSPHPGAPMPVPDDLRELTRARLHALPRGTRDELLRASALAEPTLDVLDAESLRPAEEAGVVRIRTDGRVEFAHPLLASAVYEAAQPARLRSLHAELADRVSDPEERARHMTRASDGPDDGIAGALETAADRARRRGGVEVAAELLEESARRTVEVGPPMLDRRLAAARLHLRSGDRRRAEALGREVLEQDPSGAVRASALHVLSEVAAMGADMPSAKDLLEEAIAVAADDPAQVAELELALATVLGALLDPVAAVSHAERAVELARSSRLTGLEAEALALGAGLGVMIGRGLDVDRIDRALELEDIERDAPFQQRPSLYAAIAFEFVGSLERSQALLLRLYDRLRARGEEGELAYVLVHLASTSMLAGELGPADEWATEARRTASMTGSEIFVSFALLLRASIRADGGDLEGAVTDGEEARAIATSAGWPVGVAQASWALAHVAMLRGDPATALELMEPTVALVQQIGVYEIPLAFAVPDAIEVLLLLGQLERAERLTHDLGAFGAALDRPWALAMAGRSRALLAAARGDLEDGVTAAAEALAAHERLPMAIERARTLIVLGQLLRRLRRRREARAALEEAIHVLTPRGAEPWITRAQTELERLRVRRAPAELTDNERRVAELAAAGRTNPEIARELFMSRRTVEASLSRSFRKLGIRSRAELGTRLATEESSTR